MKLDNPKSTAKIGSHPIHPMLVPFPIAFLVAALVSDLDPATAILPTGLILSAVVALILVFTGWLGGELVYKHRVAIPDQR